MMRSFQPERISFEGERRRQLLDLAERLSNLRELQDQSIPPLDENDALVRRVMKFRRELPLHDPLNPRLRDLSERAQQPALHLRMLLSEAEPLLFEQCSRYPWVALLMARGGSLLNEWEKAFPDEAVPEELIRFDRYLRPPSRSGSGRAA